MRHCEEPRMALVRGTGARGIRRLALGMIAGCLLVALAATPASAVTDFSGSAFQILAPGEEGNLPPNAFSTDQGILYNRLSSVQGSVTTKTLEKDYLPEKFGQPGEAGDTEEFTTQPGLEIWRDKHDIPHIFGATRGDVMFGSGWVAAQDRGLLLRLGLGPAFAAALSIPGINAFELLLTGRSFTPSAQALNFVTEQKKVLLEKGAEGEQVIEDLEDWVAGVNAFEETLPEAARLPTRDAVRRDRGLRVHRLDLRQRWRQRSHQLELPRRAGGKVRRKRRLEDLPRPARGQRPRSADDRSAKRSRTTACRPDRRPGALVIDRGSVSASASESDQPRRRPRGAKPRTSCSSARNTTKSGHPVAVMGPQLGYFYPEIVIQADLHGPGIDAQGIVAPISPYVFIGRGRDFAWSLTSADSENTQQFLEKLCNPDKSPPTRESEDYEYNGECIPMTTFDAGKLGAAPANPNTRCSSKKPCTVRSAARSWSKGSRTRSPTTARPAVASRPASSPSASSTPTRCTRPNSSSKLPTSSRRRSTWRTSTAKTSPTSRPGVCRSSRRAPIRACRRWATGEYDWQGFLSQEQHPHEVDPISDVLTELEQQARARMGSRI